MNVTVFSMLNYILGKLEGISYNCDQKTQVALSNVCKLIQNLLDTYSGDVTGYADKKTETNLREIQRV